MNILYHLGIIYTEVIKVIPICDEECKKNILLAKYHNTSLNDSNFCVNQIDIRTNQKCVSPPRIVIPTVEKATETKNPLKAVQLPQIKHLAKVPKQEQRQTVTVYVTKNPQSKTPTIVNTPGSVTFTPSKVQIPSKTSHIPQPSEPKRKSDAITLLQTPSVQKPQIVTQPARIKQIQPITLKSTNAIKPHEFENNIPVFVQSVKPTIIAHPVITSQTNPGSPHVVDSPKVMAISPSIQSHIEQPPAQSHIMVKPVQHQITQQPIHSHVIVTPVQPLITQQPIQSHLEVAPIQLPTIQKPAQPPDVQQPVQPPIIQKPDRPPNVQQPVQPQIIPKPDRPPNVQQPVQPPIIQKPIQSPIIQTPIQPSTIQQQIAPEHTGQLIQSHVYLKPISSQSIPQPVTVSQIAVKSPKIEKPAKKVNIKDQSNENDHHEKSKKIIINKEPVHIEKIPNNTRQFVVDKNPPQPINHEIGTSIPLPLNSYNIGYTIPYNNTLCFMNNIICTPQSLVNNPYYPFYRTYFGPIFDVYSFRNMAKYCDNMPTQQDHNQKHKHKRHKSDKDPGNKESSSTDDSSSSDSQYECEHTKKGHEAQNKKRKKHKHKELHHEGKDILKSVDTKKGEEIDDENKYSGIRKAIYLTIMKDKASKAGRNLDPNEFDDVHIVTIDDAKDTINDPIFENQTDEICTTIDDKENDLQYIESLSSDKVLENKPSDDQREVQESEPHNINKYLYHPIYREPEGRDAKRERKALLKEKAQKTRDRINKMLHIRKNDEILKKIVFGDFIKNRNIVESSHPKEHKNVIELSDSFSAIIPEKEESESSSDNTTDQVLFLSELL